jgi:hypothetical protein
MSERFWASDEKQAGYELFKRLLTSQVDWSTISTAGSRAVLDMLRDLREMMDRDPDSFMAIAVELREAILAAGFVQGRRQ